MERRTTRPGLLQWTPAPLRKSPATDPASDDSWEEDEEEEEGGGQEEDFVKQMDENGIIGLSDALEDWESGKACDRLTPEEAVPSGGEKEPKPKSPGRDHQAFTSRFGFKFGLKALTQDQSLRQREKVDGVDEDKRLGGRTRKGNELEDDSGVLHYSKSDVKPSNTSDRDPLISEPWVSPSFLPHLYHFTKEELAGAPGIEEESLPDMGFTESESHSSDASEKSSPQGSGTKLCASPQLAASLPLQNLPAEEEEEKQKADLAPETSFSKTFSLGRTRKDSSDSRLLSYERNPEGRSNPAGRVVFRPNFSNVEPRVHFPKRGYKPPKSKHSFPRTSPSSEPPMVFKSPAEIVKEVLFDASRGSSASSGSSTPTNVPGSTVPLEFRCRQQATSLLQQLQEDHDRLLTKLAEAENTIDRLRLEAKVNLYSEPPKAGHSLHSELNRNPSNLLRVDFPQAQRPEICSPGQSTPRETLDARSSPSQLGQQLSNVLFSQSEKFMQQLKTFEDLLKSDKLTSFQKLKGVSQLSEGLDSLESGYLLARDEHKLLQQRGVETCHFDPKRELEGLVFHCGLRMDELREQFQQDQLPSVCLFSSSPPNISLSAPSGLEEATETPPQTPAELFQVDAAAAEVEESPVSKKSDEEEDNEEMLKSLYSRPLISGERNIEHKQTEPLDHSQTLKERFKLPKAASSLPLNTPPKHSGEEEKKSQREGNTGVQRKVEPEQRSLRRSRPSRWATPPDPASSNSRSSDRRKSPGSSVSSLAHGASERRSSQVQTGSRRVLSQDRIISPETDSGFVGSESSNLTPAAVPNPPYQRTSESVSRTLNTNPSRPLAAALSRSPLDQSTEGRTLPSNQRRRCRQRRRSFSHSPQSCISQNKQSRADDGSSDLQMSDFCSSTSDAHSTSREQQSDALTESLLGSRSTSPPPARHRHGDPPRAPNARQDGKQRDAFMTLQSEVDRLKERVDVCLKTEKLLDTEAADHHCYSSLPIRPGEFCSDASLGRRSAQAVDDVHQEPGFSGTSRETTASASKRQQSHVLRRSEPGPPQPRVSRCTQTAARISAVNVRNSNTQTWRSSDSDASDEPDGKVQSPLCPHCSSILTGCRRHPPSSCLHHQPFDSSRKYAAVSPSALQYVSWFPSQLLLSSTPLCSSPADIVDLRSGTRRPREERGRRRRSHSADRQRSFDGSLDRAIRAARRMKQASRHMARSLASGLEYHKTLSQSGSF